MIATASKWGISYIQATANLLRKRFVPPEAFLGHIGGDDFITILNHHTYYNYISEEVISGFEEMKEDVITYHTIGIINMFWGKDVPG